MPENLRTSIIRFGDFQLNLQSGELHKHGIRLRLPGQSLTILASLLERQGEIVTREELRRTLWPEDTFVDFEHSVNSAVKRLREALNDSADNPRYVQTLPRLGYRYIGPPVAHPQRPSANESAPASAIPTAISSTEEQDTRPVDSIVATSVSKTRLGLQIPPRRLRAWAIVAALSLGLLVAAAYFVRRSRMGPVLTETDSVLLADFENRTGDPVFDNTLNQAISFQLLQSPYLDILSDARVNSTLRLMTKTPGTKLTADMAREVCQRTSSKVYVTGSIKSLGSQYVIDLIAVNCQTGDAIADEETTADRKERVLSSVGEATTNLRKRLGESLTTIQKFDVPIEEATTPSLEALQALSIGRKKQQVEGNAAAIPFFEHAIELDPNFGAAYAALGTSYSNLREPELASENLRKAYELRGKVSERERFRTSAYYYHLVTGELEKANQVYQLWAQVFPRDSVPRSNLGVVYGYLGDYEKAVAEIQEALRLYPYSSVGYTNLVSHYAALNRLNDAKAIYQQALSRNLDNPYLHLNIYGVAFLEGDTVQMQAQLAWAKGKPQAENLLLSASSDTEAYAGRLKLAREFSRQASESARRYGQDETAAEWQMNAALREAEFGNFANAQERARSVLAKVSNRELEILGALAFARSGEPGRAREIVGKLEKDFPLDTAINRYWIPSIRACLELRANNPGTALEILRASLPYELGNPLPQPEIGALLYPVYLRGQAYLQLGQGKEAAAEFQKFVDHRGITENGPLGALSHLGLARALVLDGQREKALDEYRAFLGRWKDADPGIPILISARIEYAKLKQK